ncbi:hypothetical protein BU24DRAFT_411747 [Aaosphaeria arxii CBS 175.79]|uniref:Uncharacterized protein n=1 Tax=Aaosphaeria arxii CBS 175.79 TaxID=1450172 RepID=A0A6A5XLM5_9PLEO|nr:uncharacterized protein BU24DRAFT_411747 [Aaosphaeria arxii CBS 175.79]KAF2014062.1 hypothetical protein BU24DRAFT_411747 [Aaosphaeria arxii CBS 175.79]
MMSLPTNGFAEASRIAYQEQKRQKKLLEKRTANAELDRIRQWRANSGLPRFSAIIPQMIAENVNSRDKDNNQFHDSDVEARRSSDNVPPSTLHGAYSGGRNASEHPRADTELPAKPTSFRQKIRNLFRCIKKSTEGHSAGVQNKFGGDDSGASTAVGDSEDEEISALPRIRNPRFNEVQEVKQEKGFKKFLKRLR